MRLADLDFIKLLPQFMQNDSAVRGLAAGVNAVVREAVPSILDLSRWDRIDHLPESILDEMAWEMNLLWYDKGAPLEAKRQVVRDGYKVWATLGTKSAVESVIQAYFGDGNIEEWWQYGGEPGHFRVLSGNPSINNERLNEFLALLEKVKRASAKLDGVILLSEGTAAMTIAVGLHDVGVDTHPAVSFV